MSDQPDFSALTPQLISATIRDPARGVELFAEKLPDIVAQIHQDAVRRGPLSFWGRSRNFDDLAEATIVEPCILKLIAAVARVKISPVTPHAGLQHTYGYLFSTIETPYGFKRDRWTETAIESAFGLNLTTLGPRPDAGTLLANATWLSGHIAFRGSRARMDRLENYLREKVAPELPKTKLHSCSHLRLSERVSAVWRQEKRSWTLQTDLVAAPTDSRFSLLVYSIIDHHTEAQRLITLFPIGAAGREELKDRATQRQRSDIRTRYNAYVPGLSQDVFSGTCRMKIF